MYIYVLFKICKRYFVVLLLLFLLSSSDRTCDICSYDANKLQVVFFFLTVGATEEVTSVQLEVSNTKRRQQGVVATVSSGINLGFHATSKTLNFPNTGMRRARRA